MNWTRAALVTGVVAAVVAAPAVAAWQPTTGSQVAVGSASVASQDAAGNAIENVTNVTSLHVERLHLRNVRIGSIAAGSFCLGRSVGVGNVSVAAEVCEGATAERVVAGNVTLRNVTFDGVTIREPTLARALLDDAPGRDYGNVSVETATLSNGTIETAAFDLVRVGNATWNDVSLRSGDSGAGTQESAAATLQADVVRVDRVAIDRLSAADASLGNETAVSAARGHHTAVPDARSPSGTGKA